MRGLHTVNNAGFTLIEMIVSLLLFAFIITGAYMLISRLMENYRLSTERANIERQLHMLTSTISDDLECITLINKGFCNFEIKNTKENMTISFFTSNCEEHVTKAVSLILQKTEQHLQTLTKHELSTTDSLFLQNTLNDEKNLGEIFAQYTPQKITVLGKNLLDFRVRLAIRTESGGIFFTPSNASLMYKKGVLVYKTPDKKNASIRGDLLFIDVTARTLSGSCMPQFHQSQNGHRALNEFSPDHICKSFRRIAIKGRYF